MYGTLTSLKTVFFIYFGFASQAEKVSLKYSIEVVDSNKDLIVQRNVYVEENNVKYLIELNT